MAEMNQGEDFNPILDALIDDAIRLVEDLSYRRIMPFRYDPPLLRKLAD